jgi:hypothetical protein
MSVKTRVIGEHVRSAIWFRIDGAVRRPGPPPSRPHPPMDLLHLAQSVAAAEANVIVTGRKHVKARLAAKGAGRVTRLPAITVWR